MSDAEVQANRQFTVVLRCSESAIRIPQGKAIQIAPINTPFGDYQLSIVTRTEKVPEFKTPFPRELWIEVKGAAPSLEDAAKMAFACADEYVRIAGFAANAWHGLLDLHLAFDSTRGNRRREFFQNWVFDERGIVRSARLVDTEMAVRVIRAHAQLDSKVRNRIVRAIYMYTDALQHWKQGGEIHALAQVYMGIEAITPLFIAREMKRRGLRSREELDVAIHGAPADSLRLRLATWFYVRAGGRRGSQLDSWARRELIFSGDVETYKRAKAASDKWEHATDDRGDIQRLAISSLTKTASYLRRAILALLPISEADFQLLTNGEVSEPASTYGFQRWLSGFLLGDGEDLATPENAYPIVRWEFKTQNLAVDERGGYEMTLQQRIIPMLANGISLNINNIHFSGPTPTRHTNVKLDIQRAEQKIVETPAGARMQIDIDEPRFAPWVHWYGSFMLNSNVLHPLSEYWLRGVLSLQTEPDVRGDLSANIQRIVQNLSERGIPDELQERCKAAWKEAEIVDQMREVMSVARTTPEGLSADTRGKAGMPAQVNMGEVGDLVQLNERSVGAVRNLVSLAEVAALLVQPKT
ncbi:MAG: hypothetical protein WDO12_11860 [Pseudomonadota bacterium]